MTPEEIAAHLIAHKDDPDLERILHSFQDQLTIEVVKAFSPRISAETRRDPRESEKFARICRQVANRLNTEEATAYADWYTGVASFSANKYEEALNNYRQAERYFQKSELLLIVAALQINQVVIYRDLGDYELALTLGNQAGELCASIQTQRADIYHAVLNLNLGWVFEEVGDFDRALAAYEFAQSVFVQYGENTRLASTQLNLAHLLVATDRFQEAESLFLQAMAVFKANDFIAEIARTNLNLGRLYARLGHYLDALTYYEQSLQGFDQMQLPVEVACVNQNRADTYAQLGLYREMLTVATTAENVFQQNKMKRERAMCLYYQGISYFRLGLAEKAETALQKARRLIYQQGAWRKLWLVDVERTELAEQQQQYKKAQRIAQRLLKEIDQENQPFLCARCYLVLARCHLHKKVAVARTWAEEALALSRTYHLFDLQIDATYLLAQCLKEEGEPEPAWQQLAQAIALCERVRTDLLLDEFRLSFMSNKIEMYETAVAWAHAQALPPEQSKTSLITYLNLALQAPQIESLQQPEEEKAAFHDLQTELVNLRQQWHWHHDKIIHAAEQEKDVDSAKTQPQLTQIEQEIAQLRRRLQLRQAANGPTIDRRDNLAQQIQTALCDEEAVLHFYEVNDQIQAVIITRQSIHLIPDLVTIRKLQRQLRSWQFFVQHTSLQSQQPAAANTHLNRFYQALWTKVAPYVTGITQLFLIMPPAWQELPLGACFDGRHYLIEKMCVHYLSSLEAFLNIQSQSQKTDKAKNSEAWIFGISDHGRIKQTLAESQMIADSLRSFGKIELRLEETATKQSFMAAAEQAQLIHLATHSQFRPDNPLFSWLTLADGLLTVSELHAIPFQQRPLIILSSCETGRGHTQGGGLLGMGRSFLVAGAAGLVLTLWKIEDSQTLTLMDGFYAMLPKDDFLSPGSIASALQQAQKIAIQQQLSSLTWASFIFQPG